MSIASKNGDTGVTRLMYNRRISKCHERVDAYGSVDELNAALGTSRATAEHSFVRERLLDVQKDLIVLMGELATLPEDRERYVKDGYSVVTPQTTAKLDALLKDIEAQGISFKGWATPGVNVSAASLDVARTVCRRAERRVCALRESGQLQNQELLIYLNRLSDVLWLLARYAESQERGADEENF